MHLPTSTKVAIGLGAGGLVAAGIGALLIATNPIGWVCLLGALIIGVLALGSVGAAAGLISDQAKEGSVFEKRTDFVHPKEAERFQADAAREAYETAARRQEAYEKLQMTVNNSAPRPPAP